MAIFLSAMARRKYQRYRRIGVIQGNDVTAAPWKSMPTSLLRSVAFARNASESRLIRIAD
jgi:hypothetical protein